MFKKFLLAFGFAALLASPAEASQTSTINPAIPVGSSYVTSPPLRANFMAAYNDITGLLNQIPNHSTTGQLLFNNANQMGGFTPTGDCTINPLTSPSVVCSSIGGLSPFNASNLSSGTVPPARLPLAGLSSVGAVYAFAPVSHQFLTGIGTSGAPSAAQPATTDIAGAGTAITQNIGTSGANLGLLNANLTLSGVDSFTQALGVNLNATALPTAQTGAVLQVSNADANPTRIECDAFGSTCYFTAAVRGGTAASPTTLTSGTEIGGYNGFGYNGSSVVGPRVSMRTYAAETWGSTNNGTYLDLSTTPIGTTAMATGLRVQASGGITIPPTVTGGDLGSGWVNVSGGFAINGTPLLSSLSLTAGSTNLYTVNKGSGSYTIGETVPINAQGGNSYTAYSANTCAQVTNRTSSAAMSDSFSGLAISSMTGSGCTQTINNATSAYNLTVTPHSGDTIGPLYASSFVIPAGYGCTFIANQASSNWDIDLSSCTAYNPVTAVTILPLGTSSSATNPQRQSEAGTGLFTSATGVINAAINGTGEVWRTTANGLQLFTTTSTKAIGLGGNAARVIGMEQNTNSATVGQELDINAGMAGAGTDISGGVLKLQSGLSIGTGSSNVLVQVSGNAQSNSTSDGYETGMTLLGNNFSSYSGGPSVIVGNGPGSSSTLYPFAVNTYLTPLTGSTVAAVNISPNLNFGAGTASGTYYGVYSKMLNTTNGAISGSENGAYFGVSYTDTNGTTPLFVKGLIGEAANSTTQSMNSVYGLYGHGFSSAAGNSTTEGGILTICENQAGATIGDCQGAYAVAQNNAGGVLTKGRALFGETINKGTGSITTGYALYVDTQNLGTGTISTANGVYIAADTNSGGGTITASHPLVAVGTGVSSFAGALSIGTTAPINSTQLDVRGMMTANGFISNGTTFTIASGCGTPTSLVGGATTGSFHAGQTACAPVINLPTAPNGWICSATDVTTTADTLKQTTPVSTTACTLSGTVVSGDVILFSAEAF